jgi:hypothetical protein
MVIAAGVQPVVQQIRSAVCQQTISLHLSKTDATAKLAALDGLVRELVDGA